MKRLRRREDGAPIDYGPDLRGLFLKGISRSRGWVITASVAGALLGLATGLLKPNTYESEAGLLLRMGARERITAESLVGMDERPSGTSPTMLDEIQMLSDVTIYERVAQSVGPQLILQPADPTRDDNELTSWPVKRLHELQRFVFGWAHPPHDCPSEDCAVCLRQATKVLVNSTEVTNRSGSNVIQVVHTSTSPERAQRITEALVDAFIERHREQFSSRALLEKNRGKIDLAKQARDLAANAYIEHISKSDYIDLDTQLPALEAEINALENELFSVRVRREEISRQLEMLAEQHQSQDTPSPFQPTSPPLILPNEEYESQFALKRSLIAQRWNLAFQELTEEELRQRRQGLDTQLAQVDQRLSQLPKALVHSAGRSAAPALPAPYGGVPVDETLKSEDRALAVKSEMLGERLAEKRTTMSGIRKRGLAEDLQRRDLAAVRDTKESQYQHLLERFSSLEALVSIDMIEDANLQLFNHPTLDREMAGPKRVSLLMKGLLAGLLAGVCIAMLRQRFDTRLQDPGAAGSRGGVPVLGVVSETPAVKNLSKGTAG
ncbi:MAG: GumC domain-containing protein [Planctomycetota bacterium]